MTERLRGVDGEPHQDHEFVQRFLNDAARLDEKFGISDAVGLQSQPDKKTLRMYLGLRLLGDEIADSNNFDHFYLRGIRTPAIYYLHRIRKGIENPYLAARSSLTETYSGHLQEAYPPSQRSRPLRIQNAVNHLIQQFSVQYTLKRVFSKDLNFVMWNPRSPVIREWALAWRPILIE